MRQDGRRRQDELLDAALRCFVHKGVLATGIEDVRKAAGASPSSVYHLFDGMTGLTVALLTRTFERVLGHLADRVRATTTAEQAVHALIDGHLEWVAAHQEEAATMYQAMALELAGEHRDTLAATKAALRQPIVDHLRPFVAAGDLPDWPWTTLELVLLGSSHEACRRYFAGGDVSLDWMRATLPGLAWRSVS